MAFGVTSEGFVPMRLPDIKEALETALKATFGDINLEPSSVFGQFVGVMSKVLADTWEGMEDVYNSQYPSSAIGSGLDNVLSLTGMTRLAAVYTSVTCLLDGTATTVVPAGSQVKNTNGDIFTLTEAVVIGASPTEGVFQAVESGPIQAVAGTVTEIFTPVSGWDTVTNADNGTVGRGEETDAEARARRESSLAIIGAGPVEAIRARVLNDVANVVSCSVFENRDDITDAYGRPPHSMEVVVSGGLDADIAEKIWETKPAGIAMYGTDSADITDSNGDLQTIYFSRPISKYVHVEVTIDSYTSEEAYPIDGADQLKAAILAYGQALKLGNDLIIQRWNIPIFTVPGIASVTVRQAAENGSGDPPTWVTTNMAIGATSIVDMDLSRITIIE